MKIFFNMLNICKQDSGYSALLYASLHGHTEIVSLLLFHPYIDVNILDKVYK
jgi:ankyrin repeat protein